ncbi:MAG: hypothetical protein QOF91_1666 [Alphaproteobacteria bacterium]|jgi:hypothetical protein|nr:hypothetical protein [Alphaproteobacteria bacterium]
MLFKGLEMVDRMQHAVLERQRLGFRLGKQNGRKLTKLLRSMNDRLAADARAFELKPTL